jgi:hypothetical protein
LRHGISLPEGWNGGCPRTGSTPRRCRRPR